MLMRARLTRSLWTVLLFFPGWPSFRAGCSLRPRPGKFRGFIIYTSGRGGLQTDSPPRGGGAGGPERGRQERPRKSKKDRLKAFAL